MYCTKVQHVLVPLILHKEPVICHLFPNKKIDWVESCPKFGTHLPGTCSAVVANPETFLEELQSNYVHKFQVEKFWNWQISS